MDTTTREFAEIVKRERRRKSRAAKVERAVVTVVGDSLLALIGGWALMLAVGIAHAEWIPALPTIGYWWAVVLVALLRPAFKTINASKES